MAGTDAEEEGHLAFMPQVHQLLEAAGPGARVELHLGWYTGQAFQTKWFDHLANLSKLYITHSKAGYRNEMTEAWAQAILERLAHPQYSALGNPRMELP